MPTKQMKKTKMKVRWETEERQSIEYIEKQA